MSGVFLKIVIEEPLNSNEAYIICPNHVSSLDIPIVLAAFKIPVIFMAKKEYSNIPIFGYNGSILPVLVLILLLVFYLIFKPRK